jgi:hypothetical protein
MPMVSPVRERQSPAPAVPHALIRRIRGEYEEMPCLRLTLRQASRFLHVDLDTCRHVLDHLVAEGFLVHGRAGYVKA